MLSVTTDRCTKLKRELFNFFVKTASPKQGLTNLFLYMDLNLCPKKLLSTTASININKIISIKYLKNITPLQISVST